MKQRRNWIAIAATTQPDGSVIRSIHIVHGAPLATHPVVRLAEDEGGVRPAMLRSLHVPDVMILVAPGVANGMVLEESVELAGELFRHETKAARLGVPSVSQLILEQPDGPVITGVEGDFQLDLIRAGEEWLSVGIQPPVTYPPLWVGA